MISTYRSEIATYLKEIARAREDALKVLKRYPEETHSQVNKRLGSIIYEYNQGSETLKKKCERGYKKAIELLVTLNLGLVIGEAKRQQRKGHSLNELIQGGNMGLIRAAEKYNPNHEPETYPSGIEFSTYASRWVKQGVGRTLNGLLRENISVPHKICSNISRIDITAAKLMQELKREPTPMEVAKKYNHTFYPEGKKSLEIDETQIEALNKARNSRLRIPGINNEDESYDVLASDYQTPEVMVSKREQLEIMLGFVNDGILDEREKFVIRMRYGLEGQMPMNLEEIGEQIGVTRERVRQIETKILGKLRKAMKKREAA